MPQTPKGKQGNTLFSYFKKTPTPKTEEKKLVNGNAEVLTPKRSPNSKSKKASPQSAKKQDKNKTDNLPEWAKFDVVWAKLEGFPWWPSLVCDHPTQKTHFKGGKTPQVHVQFFDEPPCRAWIKARNVRAFKGSKDPDWCEKSGQFYSLNNKIRNGVSDAEKAMGMEKDERSSMIVELLPSSEDEDEDEEEETAEPMDFDSSIFDAEMSDDEKEAKENKDSPSKKARKESASPKKDSASPKKEKSKPKRQAAKVAVEKNKRRKLMKSESGDEDSEDDFKPQQESSDDDSDSSGVDEDDVSDIEPESEPDSPVKQSRKRKKPGTPLPSSSTTKANTAEKKVTSPSVSENTKAKLSLFSAPESSTGDDSSQRNVDNFPHRQHDFMQPEKMRDLNRKLKSDPDYNPRTLYVPDSFLSKQTPAMRQWWEMKSKHYDTILFFKVGKFYELYHMDAEVGVYELGLIFMKGETAHSGFPEIAYNRYAEALVQKGYKVARVEQTETPDMMAERCKQMGRTATKYDKVVKREICQISTQGTRSYSHLDGEYGDAKNTYTLAICEKVASTEGHSVFGVCFIDTSIGTFHLGQFEDDRHHSRMRTLLAHYTPAQVLYERGKVSQKTLQLLNSLLTSSILEALAPGSEFWDSTKTLKCLSEEDYFKGDSEGESSFPAVLKSMLSENDALNLTAAESQDLAIRALGAMTWFLQYCLRDHELLSMKKFEEYCPLDSAPVGSPKKQIEQLNQRHMVLDGVTMSNLDVVWNEGTRSLEGTLLLTLDNCATAFGKRLFRQWLCAPLCQPKSIYDRLDAIEDLHGVPGIVQECMAILKKLPDLERLLARIHTVGAAGRCKNHPDTRAILYEEVTYSKRKIDDFLTTIEGFKSAMSIMKKFEQAAKTFKSKVLQKSVTLRQDEAGEDSGHFPDISEDLDFFDKAFDHKKAKKDGMIVPSKGVDADYDAAVESINKVESELAQYLEEQKKELSCRSLVYWGTGKNRFQIEVPEAAFSRVPHSYDLVSSKKGAKRYRTDEINELLAELTEAEDKKAACLKDIMRRIFYNFDERHGKWVAVVECLSVLDVLISLSTYSRSGDGVLCRPEFVNLEPGIEPFLEIREGRHPCVTRTFEGGDFIPNDTLIGLKDENDMEVDDRHAEGQVVLVTGPNMGGKSTLMRQVGLMTIMAQVGCYVPAEKFRLTPVDRIFTRLGASDKIMSGESTFFVELSETSSILQHASKHSLVLVDELGRGTATYDGTAIASAVVKELSESIKCRCLFSTHYHSLVEEFKHDTNVRLGHMACMVENEGEGDPSQETITFLYKFVKGACPKSYGFNAARLAHLPEEIIQCGVQKAKQFERSIESTKIFRNIWSDKNMEDWKADLHALF